MAFANGLIWLLDWMIGEWASEWIIHLSVIILLFIVCPFKPIWINRVLERLCIWTVSLSFIYMQNGGSVPSNLLGLREADFSTQKVHNHAQLCTKSVTIIRSTVSEDTQHSQQSINPSDSRQTHPQKASKNLPHYTILKSFTKIASKQLWKNCIFFQVLSGWGPWKLQHFVLSNHKYSSA